MLQISIIKLTKKGLLEYAKCILNLRNEQSIITIRKLLLSSTENDMRIIIVSRCLEIYNARIILPFTTSSSISKQVVYGVEQVGEFFHRRGDDTYPTVKDDTTGHVKLGRQLIEWENLVKSNPDYIRTIYNKLKSEVDQYQLAELEDIYKDIKSLQDYPCDAFPLSEGSKIIHNR